MIRGRVFGRDGRFFRISDDLSVRPAAPNVAPANGRKRAPKAAALAVTASLSEREIQIMQCLRHGKSNQEIGNSLAISIYTVKNHLQRIFRKLAVFNRTHAVSKFFMTDQTPQG